MLCSNLHISCYFYWILLIATKESLGSAPPYRFLHESTIKCEVLDVDVCKDIGYNSTIQMTTIQPNPYTAIESQSQSADAVRDFDPLMKIGCSDKLHLFLCSVYFPFCSDKAQRPITACQDLCEEVKRDCAETMRTWGYSWPDALKCHKFPVRNGASAMCVAPQPTRAPTKISTTLTSTKTSTQQSVKTTKSITKLIRRKPRVTKIRSGRTFCQLLYSRNRHNYFYVEKLQACALGCMADGIFTYDEKQLAEKWLYALSSICLVLCAMSLIITLTEYQKTCFPERSIIFITVCYLFYALSYVIRIIYGREEVTCRKSSGRDYLLIDGSSNTSCAATFLVAYCFFIAQHMWWVILCFCWFLTAGLKWNSESLKLKSTYFHVSTWVVSCCLTVVVLVLRNVDVNELTGICSVGNRYENISAFKTFLLAPMFTFLVMGLTFLVSGFISLISSPTMLNEDFSSSRSKLKLPAVTPIALYATLHAFFSTFILASYFYEYFNKLAWYNDPSSPGPSFVIFVLRNTTNFLIGISSAIWLLTMHLPTLYKKVKLKLYQPQLLLKGGPDCAVLHPLRTKHTDTNETSI